MHKESKQPIQRDAASSGSLFAIFRLQCALLGRRVWLLFALMPLATLSESLGITLLLPLFTTMMGDESQGESGKVAVAGGFVGKVLRQLPLPESTAALLAVILAAFLFKAVIRFTTDGLTGFFQARLMHDLKTRFVRAYSDLDFLAFTGRSTGYYTNVVTLQVMRFARSFMNISKAALHLLASVIYLAVAACVNWKFAVIAGIGGLIFAAVIKGVTNYVRSVSRKTSVEQANLNKQLIQVVQALKYLKATGRAGSLAQRVRDSCHQLFGFEIRTNLARAFSTSIREPLSVILVLTLVTTQVYVFQQPLGEIFIALLLLHRSTQAAFAVQTNWQLATEQVGASEMIRDELQFVSAHEEKRGTEKADQLESAVSFRNVSFQYDPADRAVLRNVSLTIPHNHTVALVGHSGAGKSTLADILTMLLRPGSGQMLIDGVDSAQLDPESWRCQIGYVCQETVVFDDSIAANICLDGAQWQSDEDVRARVIAAAEDAFLTDFIGSLPQGYDTVVGDRGVRMSGGQRQRLFIARELYKRPQLLVLDEATSALDGESEKAIQASIDALKGHMTVVLIAHRLATIRNADLIIVLDDGEVVEQGSFDSLHACGDSRFRRMVELQTL